MKKIFINLEFQNIYGGDLIIPFNLNYYISSFFYKLINDEELHNSKKIKNFSFSDILFEDRNSKIIKVKKTPHIKITSPRATIVFSSSDDNITKKMINGLEQISNNTYNRFGNVVFCLLGYNIDEEIIDDKCNMFECETLSPVCLTKKGIKYEQYIDPIKNSKEYIDYLTKSINSKVGKHVDIRILLTDDTINTKLIDIKGIKVKCYKYKFIVKCDDHESFNKIYFAGIGNKCSQGFGLFRILKRAKN